MFFWNRVRACESVCECVYRQHKHVNKNDQANKDIDKLSEQRYTSGMCVCIWEKIRIKMEFHQVLDVCEQCESQTSLSNDWFDARKWHFLLKTQLLTKLSEKERQQQRGRESA